MTEAEPSASQSRSVFDSDLDSTADVILRSTDGIHFRAHKLVLSIASPVFRDMFKLGENCGGLEEENMEGLPIVPMTEEKGEVVEKLLRLCYPVEPLVSETLDDLLPVLSATLKYQMKGPSKSLQGSLLWSQSLDREPLRAFAFACLHGLEQEARQAARKTLYRPMVRVPELRMISGFTLNLLHEYHARCKESAVGFTMNVHPNFKWAKHSSWIWVICQSMACTFYPGNVIVGNDRKYVKQWWMDYLDAARTALRDNPCGTSVTAEALLRPPLLKASNCENCRAEGFWHLKAFSELLAAEVERKNSEIIEEFNFCE